MKILYVIHGTNLLYGATRSLKHILDNTSFDYDLLYLKSLKDPIDPSKVRKYAGERCGRVYSLFLPQKSGELFNERVKHSLSRRIKAKPKAVVMAIDKLRLNRIIKRNQYDYVYLNSMALYALVTDRYPCALHVREVFTGSKKLYADIARHLAMAKKVIYIDNESQKPFMGINANSIVLKNPVDMTAVERVDARAVMQKYGVSADETIVAILGVIHADKGVDFVIRAMARARSGKLKLLIVGAGSEAYTEKCKRLCSADARVAFTGETAHPEEIYAISDCVLRADKQFCLSRTVYEGLYAGCDVLMQGDFERDAGAFEEEYRPRVHFYAPRDEAALANALDTLNKVNNAERTTKSNVREYMEAYERHLTGA